MPWNTLQFPGAPATPWEAVWRQGLTGHHGLSWPLWAPADTAGLRWFQSVVGLVQSSRRCVEVKSLTAWKLSSRARGPLPHTGPWAGSPSVDLLYRPGPPDAVKRGSLGALGLDAEGLRVVSGEWAQKRTSSLVLVRSSVLPSLPP